MSKTPTEALFDAIKNEKSEEVENIVTNLKVNVNCMEDPSGISPLLRSIFQNSPDLVKLCLKLKADVNLPSKIEDNITTPLMRAVFQRSKEIVEILLESPDIKTDYKETIDKVDYTPYERAIYQKDYDIAARILGNHSDVL